MVRLQGRTRSPRHATSAALCRSGEVVPVAFACSFSPQNLISTGAAAFSVAVPSRSPALRSKSFDPSPEGACHHRGLIGGAWRA
jgi:hypothetical protein